MSLIGDNIINITIGSLFAGGGLLLVIALAGRTGSWNIVAAYLFGLIFWGSWLANMSLFSQGEFFATAAMGWIYFLITTVMIFLFAGATIGILGGTE